MKHSNHKSKLSFETVASSVTKAAGQTPAFLIAFAIIIIWVISGPFFNFSDTWQLVINTGTTIITFLMVFLIQRSQNKDSIAVHLKLNELIVATETASNRLVAVEEITEEELKVLRKFYLRLSTLSENEMSVEESHSNVVANMKHDKKSNAIQSSSQPKGETKAAL